MHTREIILRVKILQKTPAMSLSEDFYRMAPSHQGGHSAEGKRIAEALEVPFPITMDGLIAGAIRDGLDPDELWPWCVEMRGKSLKPKTP